MTQEDLFAAKRTRDASIKQVGDAADREWKNAALAAVKKVRFAFEEFTTDHVWQQLDAWAKAGFCAHETHEPRALGAVMQSAKKLGLIVPTDKHTLSVRKECHARPVRVWKRAA